jgi:hypothetical protein
MRALTVASGIAVFLTALHFAHAIHHFYFLSPSHGPGFWAAVVFAVILDLLAFFGGYRLLRPGR